MLLNSKFTFTKCCLCFYRTHCYFYCPSIFNENCTGLIFTTPLYFASHFFIFWRIIMNSVSNFCNTKHFFKVFLIYPYFTTIFCNFNIIFSMLQQWIEQMYSFYTTYTHTYTHTHTPTHTQIDGVMINNFELFFTIFFN